ncbi:MAG: NAD(+) kinase, partial [Methanobacteriaceae archaeon]|nr:NAD(+) kinase [Methanobacteriaceae archaeon]
MRFGIVARVDVEAAVEIASKIIDFLQEKGVEIVLDKTLGLKLGKPPEMSCQLQDMDTDIVIAVGGDGT